MNCYLTDKQITSLTRQIYRGWISNFWGAVCIEAIQLNYSEKVEAFFWLLERLLREGKVKFGDPDDWSWNATPEDMIAHLKKGWPKDVTEEGDMKIVDYFYDLDRCPPISWLGEDGEWHGS